MPTRKRAPAKTPAQQPTKKRRVIRPAIYRPLPGETWEQRAARLRNAFTADMQAHGYAPWQPEYKFALKTHGRKWAIDISWPDLRVAVEIEGRGSHQRGRYLTDMEKYNRLAVMGWLLIRVTYDMIADGSALRLLEEAFAQRAQAQGGAA